MLLSLNWNRALYLSHARYSDCIIFRGDSKTLNLKTYGISWFTWEQEEFELLVIFLMVLGDGDLLQISTVICGAIIGWAKRYLITNLIHHFSNFNGDLIDCLGACKDWEWGDSEFPFNNHSLTTKQVKLLLPLPPPDFSCFNRCWSIIESDATWRIRWRKLWSGNYCQCTRFIF